MIVHIELEPESSDLIIDSDYLPDENLLGHERIILFSGKPKYSCDFDLSFYKEEKVISLPTFIEIRITENRSDSESIGELTYCESLSSENLGIIRPEQVETSIDYPSALFENAFNLVLNTNIDKLKVLVAIEPPKADYLESSEGILDLNKTDKWPIHFFRINRHEKRA